MFERKTSEVFSISLFGDQLKPQLPQQTNMQSNLGEFKIHQGKRSWWDWKPPQKAWSIAWPHLRASPSLGWASPWQCCRPAAESASGVLGSHSDSPTEQTYWKHHLTYMRLQFIQITVMFHQSHVGSLGPNIQQFSAKVFWFLILYFPAWPSQLASTRIPTHVWRMASCSHEPYFLVHLGIGRTKKKKKMGKTILLACLLQVLLKNDWQHTAKLIYWTHGSTRHRSMFGWLEA